MAALRGLLRGTAGWVVGHPRLVIALYAVLTAASIAVSATGLRLKTDQNDLVAADLEYNRRYLRFLEEFSDLEFLYVVIQVEGRPQRAMEVADAVAAEVRALEAKGHVKSVFHRIHPRELAYGFLHLDPSDLAALEAELRSRRPELEALAGARSFADLFRLFGRALSAEELAGGAEDGSRSAVLAEWGFRLLSVALRAVEDALSGRAREPLERALARELELSPRDLGYLATDNGKFLLVEILPAKDTTTVELIREPLEEIRAALDRIRARYPDVKLGLTGRPVFQADEMMTTERDMRRATIAALAGVLILFVIFFRRLERPLLAVLTLVVAIALTFGLVTVTIGYLTLLSIVFAAMLVGLGIDFGIHFVARYQEELARGKAVEQALLDSLITTGASIGTGAFTTAAAFYTTLFVDFKGLRELGFIAGSGVIICFASMVTLLPSLLRVVEERLSAAKIAKPAPPLKVPFLESVLRHARAVCALACLATVAGFLGWRGIPYNSNLLELQARGLESVEYEMLLIRESDFATWYAAFIAERSGPDGLDEVRRIVAALEPWKEKGVAGKIESVLDFIPENQEAKLPFLRRAYEAVAGLHFATPANEVDRRALAAALEDVLDATDEIQSLLLRREEPEARRYVAELDELARRLERAAESVREADSATESRLAAAQKLWLEELHELLSGVREALRAEPIRPDTLPPLLRNRFLSHDGSRLLVLCYPLKDIWEEENMEEFVSAMRAVDPGVTGTPIQVYESAWRMRDGFVRAGIYSFVAVFLLLLLDLRKLRDTLFAMVPLVVGLLWLLELIPHVGLEFNLANFFAVPILIGCGIDGGVHVVHRFRECLSSREVSRTTCAAVTLSFLTTLVGFGALAVAQHRGVASLGRMLSLGLLCLLVSSVVVLPCLLRLLETWLVARGEERRGEEPPP